MQPVATALVLGLLNRRSTTRWPLTRSDSSRIPDKAQEILGYFLRSPHAADSLEGVARWRLSEEAIYRSVDEISEAMCWLVAHGFLVRTPIAGSSPIFSLNPELAAEVTALQMASRRALDAATSHRPARSDAGTPDKRGSR